MKKILVYTLFFTLAGILVSSCGSISKMSISKRHYRSGFYVDFGRTRHTHGIAVIPVKAKKQIVTKVVTEPENRITSGSPLFASTKSYESPKVASFKKLQKDNFIVLNSSPISMVNDNQNTWGSYTIVSGSGNEPQRHANADVPFVVIVLCAIFIPPLGVGLMYGIDSYFWIDLILTLLFFFPGMIFALIVVLM